MIIQRVNIEKSVIQTVFAEMPLSAEQMINYFGYYDIFLVSFPVAQVVEHGASNAKIMGSIPRESKSWSKVKL